MGLSYAVLVMLGLLGLGRGQELACSAHSQNIYSFTINATSPLGTINLMYVQHNAARQLPLATTCLYNQLNQNQAFPRVDNFRRYPCDPILEKQTRCENSYRTTVEQEQHSGRTAFDRGHLIPVNPSRFSHESQDRTFFCVNVAPQDPFTNQNPWFTVENTTHHYLASKPGYVVTGVCDRDNKFSPTREGYKVPDCFWKMVCYKDNSNVTQVVAFIGNNTLLNNADTAGKTARTTSTTLPRSQQEVLDLMTTETFVRDAWTGAQSYLLKNRGVVNMPTATDCRAKRTAPQTVKNDWAGRMREALESQQFTEEVDLAAVIEALQI